MAKRKYTRRIPLPTVWERLLKHRKITDSGCWLYMLSVDAGGYARTRDEKGRLVSVHIYSYERVSGPVQDGFELDHTCHKPETCDKRQRGCLHRRCFNPDHLEPVTHAENVRRGRMVLVSQASAAKIKRSRTNCKHGHEYSPQNTRAAVSNGSRVCKQCARIANDKRRRREREGVGSH